MRYMPWIALVLLIGLGTLLLAERPSRVAWDQFELLALPDERGRPPIYTDGVTAKLVVHAYRALVPLRILEADLHIRVLALAGYLTAAFFLARAVLPRPELLVAFLGLLFASRVPFVWVSSELLSGALVCLAALAMLRNWSSVAVGVLLSLGALTKLDMPAMMLALLAYHGHRSGSWRRFGQAFAAFAVTWVVLTVPWHLQSGSAFYSLERSFVAFSQHYAALTFEGPSRIVVGGGDPRLDRYAEREPVDSWVRHREITAEGFPGAQTVWQAIRAHPDRYLRFLGGAIVQSAERMAGFLHILLVLIAWRYVSLWRRREPLAELDRILLVALVGFVPMVTIVYVHARYLGRYLPLFLLVVLEFYSRLSDPSWRPWVRPVYGGALVACFAIFVFRFVEEWNALEPHHIFWFPD